MSNFSEPFTSIVTPFYNTEEYLEECIESVLNQNYKNFEYILVDNQSTDESSLIASRYARKDKRIRLIRNNCFLTQVENYNHALRQVSLDSKYCKIVQADDWIFPECIKKMVQLFEVNSKIGLVSAYCIIGGNKAARVGNTGLPYNANGIFKGNEICRTQILDKYHFFGSPTAIMFRSEIVRMRTPFYRNLPFEDTIACFEILEAWDFGFLFQVESFQRFDNESITSAMRKFDPDYLLEKLIVVAIGGKGHLNSNEYDDALRYRSEEYFRFLAINAILGREKEFWNYHREGLLVIGIKLGFSTIYRQIIKELIDKIFNPKSTFEKVLKRRKKYISRN